MIDTTIDFGEALVVIDVTGIDGRGIVWEYEQPEYAYIVCECCGEPTGQFFVSDTGFAICATHVVVVPSLETR